MVGHHIIIMRYDNDPSGHSEELELNGEFYVGDFTPVQTYCARYACGKINMFFIT